MSATKLYSITSNTKVVVNALEEDVTIYWVVQSGEEDDVIENLLGKYESLSDHIQVVKKNPDVYPTFTQQYTNETVSNNSLIVECGDRFRYVPYEDIYVSEMDVYTYSYDTSFDGEGAITSAIDYVVNEELPKLYFLEGHGEGELPSGFTEQIEKENMEKDTLSLLTVDDIPEDADCLVIYAPTTDISVEERDMLAEYTQNGGKLLVMAGPSKEEDLTNLYTLLEEYGVEPVDGIVVEQDRDHYAIGYPYLSIGDGKVYLVDHDPLEEYDAQLSDLIRNDEMPGMEDVTSIQFSGTQSYEIYHQEDSTHTYSEDDVYFLRDGDLPLSTTRTEGYLNTLRFLSLTNYVNYKVTEDELAQYGLDNPDLTVTVTYTQEDDDGNSSQETATLTVGRSQDQKEQAQDAAEGEEVSAYARVGDSSIIYEITGSDYDSILAASYDDLRHQEVFYGDMTQVYQVDVTMDGATYTLTATQGEDSTTWSYGGETVDDSTTFTSGITALTASSFTSQEPQGEEEIRLLIYQKNENFPTVEVTLYRQDGTYCLAQVDGESMCLVERSTVVDLKEAINAIVLG